MRISLPTPISNSIEKIGRRAASRLRLSMPGKLVTIYETRPCIVVNLSRTGAQVGLEKPLPAGEAAILELAENEHFATVVWREQGTNGLEFEVPLSEEQVLETRNFTDKLDELERCRLRKVAQEWISGGIR